MLELLWFIKDALEQRVGIGDGCESYETTACMNADFILVL